MSAREDSDRGTNGSLGLRRSCAVASVLSFSSSHKLSSSPFIPLCFVIQELVISGPSLIPTRSCILQSSVSGISSLNSLLPCNTWQLSKLFHSCPFSDSTVSLENCCHLFEDEETKAQRIQVLFLKSLAAKLGHSPDSHFLALNFWKALLSPAWGFAARCSRVT